MSTFKENRFQKFMRVRLGTYLLAHEWQYYAAIFAIAFWTNAIVERTLGLSGQSLTWTGRVFVVVTVGVLVYSRERAKRYKENHA